MEAPLETEYKYEVVGDSWRGLVERSAPVIQGWLLHGDGVQVRVRVSGDVGTVTCKISDPTLGVATRVEIEELVPVDLAERLLCRCTTRIAKIRHRIVLDGFVYEVDEYGTELDDLIVVEVESATPPYRLPDWVGRELTGDERWSNLSLALRIRSAVDLSAEPRS
jgi:CYTH domain-containing protein